MAENYTSLGRRDFLRFIGAAGSGFVISGAYPFASAYAEEDKEKTKSQKKPGFKCTFNVNIYGRGWVRDNPDRVAKLAEPIKKRLVFPNGRETIEFLTLDFDPKNLVMFDIYKGMNRKPIASNVREDNYSKVIFPRENGRVKYSFKVTTPQSDGKKFEQDFLFMGNNGLLNIALLEKQCSKDHALSPIDNFQGLYPRAFHLTIDGWDTEYNVYGLESLAGTNVDPNDFAKFFQNRKTFPDLYSYLKYQQEHLKQPLEISPESEVK